MSRIVVRDPDGTVVSTTDLADGYTAEVCEPDDGVVLWSSLVTGPDVDVVLPLDSTVSIDVDEPECRNLTVPHGTVLVFDLARSQALEYQRRVDVMGVMRATPHEGITHYLRSVGIDEAEYVGGDEGMMTDPGVHVHHGGALEFDGTDGSVVVTSAPGTGRSHVMWHATAAAPHLTAVDFVGLGPSGVLGRYPIHLHRMGDASRGARFEGCLVADSRNRAFVPHASHGTTWVDCYAEAIDGDAFWWDKATSRTDETNQSDETHVERMTIRDVRVPEGSRGFRLTAFSLGRGRGNVMIDCVAEDVGGRKHSSGFLWPEGEALHDNGVWVFEGCTARRCENGIFAWQNTSGEHVIENFIAEDIRAWGINHGAYSNGYRYQGLTLERCDRGGVLIHASSRTEPTVIVFNDVTVRYSPIGFKTTRHQKAPQAPTYITAPSFAGVPVPFLAGGTRMPDLVEVDGAATTVLDWTDDVHPDSVWTINGVERRPPVAA